MFLTYPCLKFFVDYCEIFDYLKVMSFQEFPLVHNCFGTTCCDRELTLVFPLRNDLEFLQQIMVCSKYLRCETIYQLMAACIASWFRRRSTSEVFEEKMGFIN